MVKFKDFSRPLSVFQVLFKANFIFKDFSRQSCIFMYFSSMCEPCLLCLRAASESRREYSRHTWLFWMNWEWIDELTLLLQSEQESPSIAWHISLVSPFLVGPGPHACVALNDRTTHAARRVTAHRTYIWNSIIIMSHSTSNSLSTSWKFWHLLMIFANSLDPDQAWQNVRPDLDPNWLALW